MLVLSRKRRQGILIRIDGVEVRVSVQLIDGNVVRLGLEGPDNAEFIREEIAENDNESQQAEC